MRAEQEDPEEETEREGPMRLEEMLENGESWKPREESVLRWELTRILLTSSDLKSRTVKFETDHWKLWVTFLSSWLEIFRRLS